ncbi:MAG: redoxin domain-containing protein [Anaerolineales bacterium]|nr:redoxin domain-containing protein [Anaerolineales bacterium]
MQDQYSTIQAAGAQVVAVAVAPLADVVNMCTRTPISFPVLADEDHQVAEAYGIYNLSGDGLAAPTVIVIDTDGRVIWSRVASSTSDPVSTAEIVAQLP